MIKFPKLSVATSVVNRILNVHDEIERGAVQSAEPAGPPNVPDDNPLGAQLELALTRPPPQSDAAPDVAEAVALKGLL